MNPVQKTLLALGGVFITFSFIFLSLFPIFSTRVNWKIKLFLLLALVGLVPIALSWLFALVSWTFAPVLAAGFYYAVRARRLFNGGGGH